MMQNMEIASAAKQSRFISAARFLMICGLVYHHLFEIPGSRNSPRMNLENAGHFIPEFINSFFHMAFMAAVPLLSVITGFLFFRKGSVDFPLQLKKRFFSVALPAWIWCALWLAFAYLVWLATGGNGVFAWANYNFETFGLREFTNGVFAVRQHPYAFQFWFVRDLILTLLISPFIYFLLKRMGWALVAAGFVIWFVLPRPPVFFSGNVPMFFTVGAWLALPGGPGLQATLERLRTWAWLLVPAFLLALTARIMSHLSGPLEAALASDTFLRLLRLLGVASFALLLWEMTWRDTRPGALLVRYGPYSFFVFAAHFPLIELLQIPVTWIPGHASAPGLFLSWLCIPLLTIAVIIVAAQALEKSLPALFGLLNGGRAIRETRRAEGSPRDGAAVPGAGSPAFSQPLPKSLS